MFKFKKIASILASAIMMGSTIGLAAAASYPMPFVQNGQADVAVVYGSSPAISFTDVVEASNIKSDLVDKLLGQVTGSGSGSGGTTSVSGEAYPLFTSASPLLLNATLDNVITTLGPSELPTILADGQFESTSNVNYQQRIVLGHNPQITFQKQPSTSDDPQVGLHIGTSAQTQGIYNATVTFDTNVNFTNSDSIGTDLDLFGQKFTVGGDTSTTKLILLKSSETIDLSSAGELSKQVTVDGKTYTLELVAATDNDVTVKVTDSTGASDQKTIDTDSSKTVQGLEVGVTFANEDTARNLIQATLTIGSSKVTLQDGNAVKTGSDDDTVDGTNVEFYKTDGTSTSSPGEIGKIVFQVAAMDSDHAGIVPGQDYVDPIFGSFKLSFAGMTYPANSSDRQDIKIDSSGSNTMQVTLQSAEGDSAMSQTFINNKSGNGVMHLGDEDNHLFHVVEGTWANRSDYIVLASNDAGGLYKITGLTNSSSTTPSDDSLTLKNIFTGESTDYTATTEGTFSVNVQGRSYNLYYKGTAGSGDNMQLRVDQPESTTAGTSIVYPTIKTSKGAKVAFYQPRTIPLNNSDGAGTIGTGLMFQNGNGYTTATISAVGGPDGSGFNVTCGSTMVAIDSTNGGVNNVTSTTCAVGQLTYNITASAANTTTVYLLNPTGGNINAPAFITIEGKDNPGNYNAVITTMANSGSSNKIGVGEVYTTWGSQATSNTQLESNSDIYQTLDVFGTMTTLDKTSSDQPIATISYPLSQSEMQLYIAGNDASITSDGGTGGSSGEAGNVIMVSDSELSSVSDKNLIVVGGSCINTVAQQLLGATAPLCGADFTAQTGVGAGQYLIESFDRTGGKIATLVAGYNAADTQNAATALRTQSGIMTDAGKKYTGTTSSNAQLMIEGSSSGGSTDNTSGTTGSGGTGY